MDFRELFRQLRDRHRMFVLDDSYYSVVAFVSGCDSATGGRLLNGFREWVSLQVLKQETSGLDWPALLMAKYDLKILDMPDSDIRQRVLNEHASDLRVDLGNLLDAFLAERESQAKPGV